MFSSTEFPPRLLPSRLPAVLVLSLLLLAAAAPSLHACDVCGCYAPNQESNFESLHPRLSGFYAASVEQCTFFGTTRFSGQFASEDRRQTNLPWS